MAPVLGDVLGLELTRGGREFLGRYTVPWEYFVPSTPPPHIQAWLEAANVTLACGAFRRSMRTVGDGAYAFSVPAGTYQIDVEAPGFLPSAETVTLKAAGSERSFKLAEGRYSSIVTVSAQGGVVSDPA